ncbi:40S RIBOSOMAL PROTEIN S4 [Salix koriyanagi]|uniref:40S RIBOSOMAL PROTEIN S4 n=1 Tax=Salix koriyanagi TaxID=2511006 RepID=A0A9Q0ZU97_9ROSI|nr:40S RIBOSOMAL PROTEIN S4 [Salix koriyanagi]
MFWLMGRLGQIKLTHLVSWMLFQSQRQMRASVCSMTPKVASVFTPLEMKKPSLSFAKSALFNLGRKGSPYLNTYDGRTIRYPDPLIKANDTIKLDLESNKIVDFIKFDVGNVVMVTGGRNRGRVGVIKNREKHKGSFETIHVQDATGHEFATRLGNVFTIGKGTKPWISLPKGKGIKLSIIEEARKRQAASQTAA